MGFENLSILIKGVSGDFIYLFQICDKHVSDANGIISDMFRFDLFEN